MSKNLLRIPAYQCKDQETYYLEQYDRSSWLKTYIIRPVSYTHLTLPTNREV